MTRVRQPPSTIAGTLGYPSKMPGTSYGLPAQACITGAKLATVPNSVCSSCYALRGNYIFGSVQQSQRTRLAGITSPQWVEEMVRMLEATRGKVPPYHRWHDSGDIQARDHLAKICAVARATPWLSHWLPTREGRILKAFIRDGGTIPTNLTIRLSAPMVDGAAPQSWPTTSTVHHASAPAGHICPAPQQGNSCGDCRACWDNTIPNVSYHKH